MGNTDSIPVISQAKSAIQAIGGDSAGALRTQQNFAYNNTFPIISQIASAGYAIGGDMDKARDLQEKFAADFERVVDSIPVAGHIKGGVHYALGEPEKGEEALKAASRSTGVIIGGIGGGLIGGPAGAVAGGIAGGAAADGIITGSDIIAKGSDEAKPYGYVAVAKNIADAVITHDKISVDDGFDMALLPASDGLGGYVGGKFVGRPAGLKPGSFAGTAIKDMAATESKIGGAGRAVNPKFASTLSDTGAKTVVKAGDVKVSTVVNERPVLTPLEKLTLDNRANQLNPNHVSSGPGRPAGYRGLGTKADLDNHANQMNPNNVGYKLSRNENSPALVIKDTDNMV